MHIHPYNSTIIKTYIQRTILLLISASYYYLLRKISIWQF